MYYCLVNIICYIIKQDIRIYVASETPGPNGLKNFVDTHGCHGCVMAKKSIFSQDFFSTGNAGSFSQFLIKCYQNSKLLVMIRDSSGIKKSLCENVVTKICYAQECEISANKVLKFHNKKSQKSQIPRKIIRRKSSRNRKI